VANTYVITSVSIVAGVLMVVGTVNGTPVSVNISAVSVGNNLASAVGFQQFIAGAMLAAVPPNSVAYPSLAMTFTQ
jgi:hypothetical protein